MNVQTSTHTDIEASTMQSQYEDYHISSPIHLKFENLTVKVDGKYILQNVTGEVKPGEILAIMGPSGAGKSTLLNMLSGRNNGMELEDGCILINNQKANKRLRRRIGYVVQEDIFLSHLTVKQSLEFVGEIVIPDSVTKEKKAEIVNKVVDELSLNKCLDTIMGGGMFTSGCSGGEKKRCSIAVELIKNPGMLIMDEPTSGLDAAIACSLIKSIKNLAEKQHRAVITSIHQPSSHVFHMFDKLLLLCNGQVAYYGRTDGVLKFFDSLKLPCYPNWNPADFILEKLSDGHDAEERIVAKYDEIKRSTGIAYLDVSEMNDCTNNKSIELGVSSNVRNGDNDATVNGDGYIEIHAPGTNKLSSINLGYSTDEDTVESKNEIMHKGTLQVHDIQINAEPPVNELTTDFDDPKWPTGFRTQFVALCKRAFIQTRKAILDKFGFAQALGIAVASSLIWFNTPYDEHSITDRNGICFFIMVYLIMSPMFFSILTFPPERDTIAKERAAGMYRLSAYFMAKNVSEIPVLLLQPMMIYTIVYWCTGLNRSPVFLVGLLCVTTICLLAQSIGYCFGALITNLRKSISICVVFALTCMLMGGFYTRRMPKWLTWARYLSHISHAYNIQHRLEFTYATRRFKCAPTNSIFDVCKGNGTRWIHGSEVQERYSTLDLTISESFLILWVYIIICRSLFYIFLRYFNRPK